MVLCLSENEKESLETWLDEHASGLKSPDVSLFKEYVIELLTSASDDHWFTDPNSFRKALVEHLAGLVENVHEFTNQLYDALKCKTYLTQQQTPFVLVMNVPLSKLHREEIRSNFEPFGAIQSCKVDLERRTLLIEYNNPSCAIRCTKTATTFFGNRFVEVELLEKPSQFEGTVLQLYGESDSDQASLAGSAGSGVPGAQPSEVSVTPNVNPNILDPAGSLEVKSKFNKRVEEVQTLQQSLFEERQRKNKRYQEQLNDLLNSKERLLHVHQAMLEELATKIEQLPPEDDTLHAYAKEFADIVDSMSRLDIMPAEMVKQKIEKFALDNPSSSLMVRNARLQKMRSKRNRKASALKRRAKRKK